ncbi:MAG: glycosyltransferase [Fimbriimonadales bacterium]|nr:glycosyltransferase [Fimbriimonadales bacterium]
MPESPTLHSTETPRVLFQIVPTLRPAGAERVVVHLLQHCDRTKYRPVCVCLGKPLGSHYEQMVQDLGIPLHFLGKGQWATLGLIRRLDVLFRHYRPTIAHMHLRGLTYAYPLLLRHKTPVCVYTVHNLAWHDQGTRFQKLVATLAFRYRVGRVVPVAIAKRVRESIQQVFGYPNAPLIPNGIAMDEFALPAEARSHWRRKEGIGEDTLVVAHVGRFTKQKNHEMLIHAFARLHLPPSACLLLVGEGELQPQTEQLVRDLGLADKVRFLGVRADIPELLNASDIFVLSSRWEGNPMSVMEAMAAGLPVVATAVGGVPELVDDGVSGLLVSSEDVAAFAHALQTLVDNPDLRAAMGSKARQVAQERFDARVMTHAYESLYETILAGK